MTKEQQIDGPISERFRKPSKCVIEFHFGVSQKTQKKHKKNTRDPNDSREQRK